MNKKACAECEFWQNGCCVMPVCVELDSLSLATRKSEFLESKAEYI